MKVYDFKGKKNACGKNIRRIRNEKGWSLDELAAKVQLEELMLQIGSISRIERGTRFVADYELYVFARVLGTTIDELMVIQEDE